MAVGLRKTVYYQTQDHPEFSSEPTRDGMDFYFSFKHDEQRLKDVSKSEVSAGTGIAQNDAEVHSLDRLQIASGTDGYFRSRHLVPAHAARRKIASSVIEIECEGLVESVREDHFVARLNRIRGVGDPDTFCAEFPKKQVAAGDKDLLVEGALFRWSVGYDSIDGTKQRFSRLVFRRLPAWTAQSLAVSRHRMQEVVASIEWADDPCD